jgi:hypothetical protein
MTSCEAGRFARAITPSPKVAAVTTVAVSGGAKPVTGSQTISPSWSKTRV